MQYIIIYLFVLLHDRKSNISCLQITHIFLFLCLFDISVCGDVGV